MSEGRREVHSSLERRMFVFEPAQMAAIPPSIVALSFQGITNVLRLYSDCFQLEIKETHPLFSHTHLPGGISAALSSTVREMMVPTEGKR